nr:LD-carboxypeptidase [Spirochaetales bacterium]
TDRNVSIPSADSVIIHSGRASGTVTGGNLTTLSHLVGTPFAPDFSGHILLLEDIGESAYRIDRMLTHMKMAGCFEQINGIVLGAFTGCGDPADIYQIFYDNFAKDSIPVLAGFSFGHDEPNLSVPFGIQATLDTDSGLLSFAEPLFS